MGKKEALQSLEVPNAILLGEVKKALRSGHTATITVKGYSMRPFLEHRRDKVKLAAAQAESLQVGDAVLAEVSPDVYLLHRIIRIEGENVTMMGDGNPRGVERCTRAHVVGVVTHYYHKGREIPASSASLCRRVRLWRMLLPVRRYLLFIYKVKLKLTDRF